MKSFDIVIVGAGPAGMAAAISAGSGSGTVAVIDDNHFVGGQIWRGGGGPVRKFAESGAQLMCGLRVIDADARLKLLTVEGGGEIFKVQYSKLILATGARELFLPFPGWTLPHVFGVGGLQALAKAGLPVQGKRIVVAGSGPLLLAVAAYLKQHGAEVPLIAEQAPWSKLTNFGVALLKHPGKIRQAVEIKSSLMSTKYVPDCWVTEARGTRSVEEVTLTRNGRSVQERCDYLAVSYGFVPNTELQQLLGCGLTPEGFVTVDEHQQTTLEDIYCVGEPTGLGGVDKSLLDGEIAGKAACGEPVHWNRKRIDRFTIALNAAFALRPELTKTVRPDTIVCRCEDVTFERLQQAANWREAKLHFRCGMGPCQGRVCGPAVNALFGWRNDSIRQPIFPATIKNLIG